MTDPITPTAITADDDAIRAAVADGAVTPPLLAALAYATGDLSLLRVDLRPDPTQLLDPNGGLSADQIAQAQDLAVATLAGLRDGEIPLTDPPDEAALAEMLQFLAGGADMASYLELFREELAPAGEDPRAPGWTKDDVGPDTPFLVAIVGAGMSGIVAAHRLEQAGVPYVVFERNDDVGGTWLDNTYPGCRVDVPNHLYSYSFAQRPDWPGHFSSRDVLLDYFRDCADEFGVRKHIRFGTEVVSAEFSDADCTWSMCIRGPDGAEERIEANAIISAVGQLNRPKLPEIVGRDLFGGPSFHSARWDHDVDLADKRVAAIGTGASAMQFIPAIADDVAELRVFQRTPAWLIPTPDQHADVSRGALWLFDHLPSYTEWYRFWLFWRSAEGMLPAAKVDPDWEPQARSVSVLNDMVRQMLTTYIETEFADQPELLEHVVPTYPPGAKRVIRDDGIWARTLAQEQVHLVTDDIVEITADGVVTADGTLHDVDVIIYGTGFHASKFLTPMQLIGRDGADLHRDWDGDARAYLGITIPNFPNLFCLYGPNTNIVVNGSIIYFSECEVQYALGCIRLLLEGGHDAMDCRAGVHDDYNARIDAGNLSMAWGVSTVNSWYRNKTGRSAQNWPFSLLEYWEQTRLPDPTDYELLSAGA